MAATRWGMSPRQSIEAECARRGEAALVAGCMDLLSGRVRDADLLRALAGPAATTVLRGEAGGLEGYWPRVWGARGLLYAWDAHAGAAVIRATTDDAWRVREMAAKVVARRRLGRAAPAMVTLCEDPVPRVRRAAERALQTLVVTGA
jgi:HEAT repeat protein